MSKPIHVGPFNLHELIGKGGMGEVWQGVHREQQVPVAVKVITAEVARQPRYLEAFRNEVTAVARLDHPGIVWVLDYGTISPKAESESGGSLVSGSPYLTMEFASGGTLHGVMKELDWPAVKRVLLELLDALSHAHARGVIHRDLKPGNVLLSRLGDVRPGLKLTDFGIARAADFTPEETGGKPLGTLHYMAPEQVRAEWRQQGPWTDLYAVGCMAYRLVTGRLPFKGMRTAALMHAQIHKTPPPLSPRFETPPWLDEWIATLMAKNPTDRFRRAADAAHALLSLPDPISESGDTSSLAAQFSGGTRLPVDSTSLYEPFSPTALSVSDADKGVDLASKMASTRHPLPRSWRRPVPTRPSPQLLGAGLGLWGIRTVPLVGRESARDKLWNQLRDARRSHRARLVMVRGPAGTGKTRLVEWIGQRADEVGSAIQVSGLCTRQAPKGHGLRDLASSFLRTAGLDPEDLLEHLEEQLTGLGLHADLIGPVAALVRTDPLFDSFRLEDAERFELIGSILEASATERPLWITFDNAHYDPEVLAFARWWTIRTEDDPLPAVLLLTIRDEDLAESPAAADEVDALAALPDSVVVEVQNLKRSHRSVLVRELLGLQPVLAAQVEKRTGGNPLFTIQLVSDWVASDMLEVAEDGFTLRDPEQATLPRSLDEVWRERMRRAMRGLPDADAMLERAAVLGEAVDLVEWSQLCDDPTGRAAVKGQMYFKPGAARTRHQLVNRLFESHLAEETDHGWRFMHGMFRETVLDAARQAGRLQDHHDAVARMLELQDTADEERRAIHLVQAGRSEQAIPMLLRAVDLRSLNSLPAALELVGRTEAALQATQLPRSNEFWGRASLARCTLFHRMGRRRLAEEKLKPLLEEARRYNWKDIKTEAQVLRAEVGMRLESASALSRALKLDESLAPDTEASYRLRSALTELQLQRGDTEQALNVASLVVHDTSESSEDHQATGWFLMGRVCAASGSADEAMAFFAHCVRVYRSSEMHQLKLAWALLALGEAYHERGSLRRARTHLRQCVRIFRRTGSSDAVHGLAALGELALTRESWQDALLLFTLSARQSLTDGAPSMHLRCHAGLVAATAGLRDWTNCARHLTDGERTSERTRHVHVPNTIAILIQSARFLKRRKREDLAERTLRLARRLASQSGDKQQVEQIDRSLDGRT